MNEREMETNFHSQFEIAGLGLGGREMLAHGTQRRLAVTASRLTGCKAISLFGNTVASVCWIKADTREPESC